MERPNMPGPTMITLAMAGPTTTGPTTIVPAMAGPVVAEATPEFGTPPSKVPETPEYRYQAT